MIKDLSLIKNFWSYISNGIYSVGCTGQTVYVYDKDSNECAKFKDLRYAYYSAISPNGKLFVVKSTEGRMAVYSLESLSLIKKFRFSKVDGAQDDGYCFTNDSKWFINLERHKDDLHTAISWYDTENFERTHFLQLDDNTMIQEIEQSADGIIYALGFYRGKTGNEPFVGIINESGICQSYIITEAEEKYYLALYNARRAGFASRQWEWAYVDFVDFEEMKSSNHSFKKLYAYYQNKEGAD